MAVCGNTYLLEGNGFCIRKAGHEGVCEPRDSLAEMRAQFENHEDLGRDDVEVLILMVDDARERMEVAKRERGEALERVALLCDSARVDTLTKIRLAIATRDWEEIGSEELDQLVRLLDVARLDVRRIRNAIHAAAAFIETVRPYLDAAHHVDKCDIRNATRRRGAKCTCGRFAAFDALDAYDAMKAGVG